MRYFWLIVVGFLGLILFPQTANAQYEGYEIVMVPPGSSGSSAFAACPTGKVVIGGGYTASGDFTVNSSHPYQHPDGRVGWWVEGDEGIDGGSPYAHAICVNADQGSGGGQVQPPPTNVPDLSGTWHGGSTEVNITQSGTTLTVKMGSNEYTGQFESTSTIRVPFYGSCCLGTLSNNNTRIDWDNESSWTKGNPW